MRHAQLLFSCSLFTACAGGGMSPPQRPAADQLWPPADADEGLVDTAVADLFRREWAWSLESDPEQATRIGVHRFDDRLEDNSPEGIAAFRAERRKLLAEAKTIAARTDLPASDRTALELMVEDFESGVASEICAFEEWSLSASENPVTEWNRLAEQHPVTSPEDGENLSARYAKIPANIDHQIAHLRRGLAKGLVANAESTRRVIDMVKKQLAKPVAEWPLLEPAKAEHADWQKPTLDRFRGALRRTVEEDIKPALGRYLQLVEGEILPRARGDDKPGLVHLPSGAECYRARSHAFTTIDRTPEELHQTGLQEIARLDKELAQLGKQALGTKDLAETIQHLRSDPALYFSSAEEIEAKAKRTLDRARAAIPRFFNVLPKADCTVVRIPDYEAPYSTIAYYRPPVPDGSKPGQYFVNVYQPQTRPRFEAAVLAFHESIPGHHLQIAISQELKTVPAFRKNVFADSFVEGWALYTERLAEEMGLYEDALDRIGMLSFDAWRASRLVVDTGLHAMGWSRQQAVDFMLAHTALAPGNISNEVDRYIVWPGQALAYKTGQLEILALRKHAEEVLGSRFDLRKFHDAVLLGGGVSLPVLRRQIEAYVTSEPTKSQ